MIDVAALLQGAVIELQRNPALRSELRALLATPEPAERETPIFLAPSDFAKRLCVSRRTVFYWLDRGLPRIGAGKCRRIPLREAEAWLREQGTGGSSEVEVAAKSAALREARRG